MNDIPVKLARELVRTYGFSLLDDPERLGQLLEDKCGEYKYEIFVLTFALREISKRGALPSAEEFRDLRSQTEAQFRDNLGFGAKTSRWAVDAIAGILLDAEEAADASGASGSPSGHIEARRGFLQNIGLIGRGIARKPRTAPVRKKVLRNSLLLVAILAIFFGLFVGMGGRLTPDSDEHRILFLAHLSGAEAGRGHIRLKAAQLAADQINALDGIKRRPLRLQAQDIPTAPEEAVRTLRGILRDRNTIAMISACDEEVNAAIAELSDEYELPLVATESSGIAVTMASRERPWLYSFRTNFDDAYKGKLLAYFVSHGLKRKRIVLLTDRYDEHSTAIGEAFVEAAGLFEDAQVSTATYTRRGALDRASANEVAESGADAVVIANTDADITQVLQMLRRAGYANTILGLAYNDAMQSVGGRFLDDSWWIVPASPDDPQLQSFQASYRDKYNESVPRDDFVGTVLAYDSVRWMADALYRAPGFQGEALRHAFLSTRNLALSHATLTVDPRTHNPWNKAAALIYCSEGRGRFQRRFRPQ